MILFSYAIFNNSATLFTFNFFIKLLLCVLTVSGLIFKLVAMFLEDFPFPINFKTSLSLPVINTV